MSFSVRLGGPLVGFAGLLLALTAIPAFSSDTNFFLLNNALKAATEADTQIEFIKFKTSPRFLLGDNATAGRHLAVAVSDFDCLPNGVRPHFQLVLLDDSNHVVVTLVDFVEPTFLFNGDRSAMVRVRGEGREGVVAAELEALISYSFDSCTLNQPAVMKKVLIEPLGYVKPAFVSSVANIVLPPDQGEFEILSSDPQNPEILLPINAQSARPSPGCNIDLNPTTLNFGNVATDETNSLPFQIRNNGTAQCTVSNIVRNGSSKFTFAGNGGSFLLDPGAFTNVVVTFAPDANGPQNATIRVTSTETQQFVTVTGNGVGSFNCKITVNPGSLNFGTVEIMTNKILNVTLTNTGMITCGVDRVSLVSSSTEFSVLTSTNDLTLLPPGASTNLAVRYQPTDITTDTGQLQIRTANADQPDVVTLMGSGAVARCSLTFSPESIPFGATQVGASRDRILTVSNTGIVPCQINAAFITNNLVTNNIQFSVSAAVAVVPVGQSTNLTVTFMPSEAGNDTATLRIETDDPDSPANISLSGLGVIPSPLCHIDAVPSPVDFGGRVAVGQSSNIIVVVSNTGQSNCFVTSVALTSDTSSQFTLVSTPATPFALAPNAFALVTVRYAPTSVANASGTLRITSDDPLGPFTDVALQGNGFTCELVLTTNSLEFGEVMVGDTVSMSAFISNANPTEVSCTVDAINLTGSGDFHLDPFAPHAPFTIDPMDSVEIPILYSPTNRGLDTGALQIHSGDAGGTLTVSLSGTGVQCHLTVSPSSLQFGTVVVGSTNVINVTIENAGNADCSLNDLLVLNNGNIEFTSPAPTNLVPAAHVNVGVNYVPENIQSVIIYGGKLKSTGKVIAP